MKLLFNFKSSIWRGTQRYLLVLLTISLTFLYSPTPYAAYGMESPTESSLESDSGSVLSEERPIATPDDHTKYTTIDERTVTEEVYEEEQLSDMLINRLIIFKEGLFPADLQEWSLEWPDVKFTLMPEVGMLKISSYSKRYITLAEEAIYQRYLSSIETAGNDLEIENGQDNSLMFPLENIPLTGADKLSLLSSQSKMQNNLSSSKAGSKALTSNRHVSETGVDIENASLYDFWGWDIKEVTKDGQSFSLQSGNKSVVVAVIDSGIDMNHPDLAGNIVNEGKSFVPGVNDTVDRLGHGTMIAGTIAANGKLLGVGPNLGLIPYKVFDQGGAETSWVIEAIIQAVKDDVDVINLSVGTYKSLTKPEDQAALLGYMRALLYAQLNNVVVVASSGTDGLDIGNPAALANALGFSGDLMVHAPGGLPGVITVSATNKEHERAYYSNYGLRQMIAAPAGDYGSTWFTKGELNLLSMCLTTYPTNLPQSYLSQLAGFPPGYEFMIGTSLAAPKVSAAAALLIAEGKEKRVSMGPEKVKRLLQQSAIDYGVPGPDLDLGVGVLNVYESLRLVR